MKLYGISNCNTVKNARNWLSEHGHDIPFHDFKKAGIDEDSIRSWLATEDWNRLVNRQGTTWRQLSEAEKSMVRDDASAIALMLKKPSVIKRPVLEFENGILVGFDEQLYSDFFNK